MSLALTTPKLSEHVRQTTMVCGVRLPKLSNRFCKEIMAATNHIQPPSPSSSNEEVNSYLESVDAINQAYTYLRYQKLGIEIVAEVDDLFYEVVLPEGWHVEPRSGTAYWSELVDENDRLIGEVFCKTAFYDRDAFIDFKEELA